MVSLIVLLILVGVGLYLINTVLPLDPNIKTIINVVILLVVVLYILQVFGLLSPLGGPIRLR
jgi:hypothetical protein